MNSSNRHPENGNSNKPIKKVGNSLVAPVSIGEIHILMQTLHQCKICAMACAKDNKTVALICLECAEVCHLAIRFKSCRAKFTAKVLSLCMFICKQCEKECKVIPLDVCQQCAKTCQECAKVIRDNLKNGSQGG
ncbi:hypothetical protein [Candidatus Protochlamydia phocaeensis]|uniref:hypothetical protein n=1 Tax=Candidatus Protochlamydia phocaeensis TaxID=1414722 RepID=UPI0008393BC4|nr:hypothetical protein [Candidatus Protochlamydia phocaeensis]